MAALRPCQGSVPRLKYMSMYPSDSMSSRRLCAVRKWRLRGGQSQSTQPNATCCRGVHTYIRMHVFQKTSHTDAPIPQILACSGRADPHSMVWVEPADSCCCQLTTGSFITQCRRSVLASGSRSTTSISLKYESHCSLTSCKRTSRGNQPMYVH